MEGTREERILSYWTCKKHMFMSVSGLHTMAVIGSNFVGALQSYDWGTVIALGAISALLGASVLLAIRGDLGYLVDAFT